MRTAGAQSSSSSSGGSGASSSSFAGVQLSFEPSKYDAVAQLWEFLVRRRAHVRVVAWLGAA